MVPADGPADAAALIALAERWGAHNYHPLPVVLSKAQGSRVWDTEGREYLDFLSCYSALSHGHRHARIMAALMDQAERITLTSRAFHNDQMGPFLAELCAYADAEMALPMNTGAEAVETALKIARKWAYEVKGVPRDKAEIIVCDNNFHGRTVTIVSFSTEELYREDFGPYTPGFKVIPYGDIDALRAAITPNTAAFLVEPLQGEAGVVVPPAGYLTAARALTRANNVLLALDEVQTGLGRTGRPFCHQYEDAPPDLLILGKALGGGVYPVSAVLGSADILGLFRPGEHGSTFGGNPLGCAVARESLRVLQDERLAERAAELGDYLMLRLSKLDSPLVRGVRGKGLLIGLVLQPQAGGARRFCEALMTKGVLCKETHEDVIRFAPPLVIDRDDIDWALDRVQEVMASG